MKEQLIEKVKSLTQRLKNQNITDQEISSDSYHKYDSTSFVSPEEIAQRIIIEYAVFYGAINNDKIDKIKNWLIACNLWSKLYDLEKIFFEGKITSPEEIKNLAWRIEKAYILAWTLDIVKDRPQTIDQISDKQFDNFILNVPKIGTKDLSRFICGQQLRSMNEIYEEYLFYTEVTTTQSSRLFIETKKIGLTPGASFARYSTLAWVCKSKTGN
ncbi:DUF4272 domain-containing protein [Mangrovibacterium diazotrophicum]|uniref:Uncharacterized protein DUF4272 n=1 Tax=Mangrovibacterium diazotrophicum TaxID=1261403 RepID=A0A419W831_9BACT|nr:DUF4272 domain-containing protein [Mangrovibacterium diazotrophicum]RKD91633.1 uncharacterized protein DUF4272 [Mangrovibacterium diazotrophicum]